MRSVRLICLGVLALAVAFVGAACSADSTGNEGSAPAAGDRAEPSTDTERDPARPSDADACLHRTWLLPNEELRAYFGQLGSVIGLAMEVNGDATVAYLPDGVFVSEVRDLTVSFDFAGRDTLIELRGRIEGTYEDEGMTLATTEITENPVVHYMVEGQESEPPALVTDLLTDFLSADSAYVCAGETLTVDFPTPEGTVPITLTPA